MPTAGAPLLTISLTSTNTAIVQWPSTGFNLQQTMDLTTAWGAAPEIINDNGTNKFIVVTTPAGHRFFRLRSP